MSKPYILILDEPTNHLDTESIDALADALVEFSGGIVVVSHNSRLVSRVCEDQEKSEIWEVDNGRVERFDGSYEEYEENLMKEIRVEVENLWALNDMKNEELHEHAGAIAEGKHGLALWESSDIQPLNLEDFSFAHKQANNAYIFPWLGFELVISGAIRVHDEMLLAARNEYSMQLNASRIKVLQAQDDLVNAMREAASEDLLNVQPIHIWSSLTKFTVMRHPETSYWSPLSQQPLSKKDKKWFIKMEMYGPKFKAVGANSSLRP
ncbi:ABC transporter F family member 4-like protein [Tanacetum coccineum]